MVAVTLVLWVLKMILLDHCLMLLFQRMVKLKSPCHYLSSNNIVARSPLTYLIGGIIDALIINLKYSCIFPSLLCSNILVVYVNSGIFKIDGKEYISLAGHLSNKSCEKVWNLSRQMTPLVELKTLPRLEVWPKAWEASKPDGDNIGMYFFPLDMRLRFLT